MENVDIVSNLKYVQLSKRVNRTRINSRELGYIVASLYESNTNFLELSNDWYLSWLLNDEDDYWYVINWNLWLGRNIWKITTWSWVVYWFLITSNYFTKWEYQPNRYALWYYDEYWWINNDPNFNTTTWWTIGTWWTISWWYANHTPWNIQSLSRSLSPTVWQKYRVAVRGWFIKFGSVDVKIWWNYIGTINSSSLNKTLTFYYTASNSSETLEFIPSRNFDWALDFCYIEEIRATSYTKNFSNEKTPYIISWNYIYIWNGNTITQVDMTSWTPIISDVLTIDKSFSIVWITRIADQFFIYATDWTNWKQYIWDWIETSCSREITRIDKPILNVANFANQDYIIVWTNSRQWLYLVNWYQLNALVVTDDYVNIWDRIYFTPSQTNSIETIWNKLLISWYWCVYSYWNKIPWTPNALVKLYTHNWWWLTNIFYKESLWYLIFIYFSWIIGDNDNHQWLGYFGNYRAQIYLPSWNNNEEYARICENHTWWIETNPIFWETYSNTKHTTKMTLWVKLQTNTQINVYQKEREEENYANLYVSGHNLWFSVWDVYSFQWKNYTILNINHIDGLCWYLLYCSYTWTKLTWIPKWSFTKVSWTGDAVVYVNNIKYWYKLLLECKDITKTKYSFSCPSSWNETQYAFELISYNMRNTPKLYDVNLYYDEIIND